MSFRKTLNVYSSWALDAIHINVQISGVAYDSLTQRDTSVDPTLDIAERQLAMLGELAEMAMTAARVFTASAVASAKAAEAILDDKYFRPEVGRANACGAKDAAESLQKVTRAVRLTLMLEMKVAEIVRDIRAGVVTHIGGVAVSRGAGETPADQEGLLVRRRPAGSCLRNRDADGETDRRETERLDIERPDILPRAPFRETVEHIRADLGAEDDWSTSKFGGPDFECRSRGSSVPEIAPPPPSCGGGGARPGLLSPQAPCLVAPRPLRHGARKSAAPPPPQESG